MYSRDFDKAEKLSGRLDEIAQGAMDSKRDDDDNNGEVEELQLGLEGRRSHREALAPTGEFSDDDFSPGETLRGVFDE